MSTRNLPLSKKHSQQAEHSPSLIKRQGTNMSGSSKRLRSGGTVTFKRPAQSSQRPSATNLVGTPGSGSNRQSVADVTAAASDQHLDYSHRQGRRSLNQTAQDAQSSSSNGTAAIGRQSTQGSKLASINKKKSTKASRSM